MDTLRHAVVALLLLSCAVDAPAAGAASSARSHPRTSAARGGTSTQSHERRAGRPTTPRAEGRKRISVPKAREFQRLRASEQPRDPRGRFVRSASAKREFEKQTGYPNGRPGYIVDHIVPLACGGADAPSNMQWQTVAEAKAKDRVERKGCGR